MKGFTSSAQRVPGLQLGRSLDPLDERDGGPVATSFGWNLDAGPLTRNVKMGKGGATVVDPAAVLEKLRAKGWKVGEQAGRVVVQRGEGAESSGYDDNGAVVDADVLADPSRPWRGRPTIDATRPAGGGPVRTTMPVTTIPVADATRPWQGVIPSGPDAPVTPEPQDTSTIAETPPASTSNKKGVVVLVGFAVLVILIASRS